MSIVGNGNAIKGHKTSILRREYERRESYYASLKWCEMRAHERILFSAVSIMLFLSVYGFTKSFSSLKWIWQYF